ncbi:MAG: hypothetical protein JW822_05315 [Spirochaetales bacterium]|nr:hypothetical protein [Spirochaetales bacterium]
MNEIPKLKHTVYISHAIEVPKNAEDTFTFITKNLPKVYAQLACGHEYFTIRNGTEIKRNSIIDCAEKAGNQSITHEYHVTEIHNNNRIAYVSNKSRVLIKLPWNTIESKSNTYVFYDFYATENNHTRIKLTIGIQFSNGFEKFFSTLFGGLIPWKKHCIEEMEGLKKILGE